MHSTKTESKAKESKLPGGMRNYYSGNDTGRLSKKTKGNKVIREDETRTRTQYKAQARKELNRDDRLKHANLTKRGRQNKPKAEYSKITRN